MRFVRGTIYKVFWYVLNYKYFTESPHSITHWILVVFGQRRIQLIFLLIKYHSFRIISISEKGKQKSQMIKYACQNKQYPSRRIGDGFNSQSGGRNRQVGKISRDRFFRIPHIKFLILSLKVRNIFFLKPLFFSRCCTKCHFGQFFNTL